MLEFLLGLAALYVLKETSPRAPANEAPARPARKLRTPEGRDRTRGHRAGGLRAKRDEDREREGDSE